jgi:membrane fusion protein (multidrug efflux system)
MSTKKKTFYIIIVFAIVIALIALKFATSTSEKRGTPQPFIVKGNAKKGEIVNSLTFTGDIMPIQQATIYSKVNGNLEKIFVDIGSIVSQNQTLALIDTTIYAQNLKLANANYLQADVTFQNNKITYERNKKLFEQNLIAKQDLENAKTTMDASMAQREAAYANYSNALTQLSYCRVTAPFSGIITKRYFDQGAYINASGSSPNSSLYILMNVSRLKSYLNIPEKNVPLLDKVTGIQVTADALPKIIFKADIKKISEAVDLTTRTMQIEIDIENSNKMLKPGMFANITMIMDKKENALILPNQVVQNDDYGNFVYVIKPDTTVEKRYISIGIKQDTKYEVLSGITEKDPVVFIGQSLIRNKMKVKILK